ncbi:oligosaccharide flippase family protein [Spirochaetales bacterium NM-380-WT-3C1]|uniref:Oligosaccharide flippase family protein n=1 Tax=Bullifex porci TaxID=2606638 RepID=A0A7X2TR41_9SPIO|nr:oligosaccharide flippase family protein [Bullifex porci]MSU05588.1 oligosaccharide flippase family protein [Bullifex porci]
MKKNILKNIIMLYGLSIAKIVFPLLTLPYLTRVLSVDTYGVVSYVKTIMTYLQIFVDFGFMLSGTKDIIKVRDDKNKLGFVVGDVLLARIILGLIGFAVLIVLTITLPILRENILYTYITYFAVFLSVFLFDYVFRGLEEMQVITIRFVAMKGIAAVLTFVFVHNDADIMWIPILDCLGTFVSVVFVLIELNKRTIKVAFTSISNAVKKLGESAVYFASEMATTAFGALNTVLIGAFLSKADVAYWSLCISMTSAVQAMYSPINNGIYPDMVKNKNLNIIKKTLKLIMPVVAAGCLFTIVVAKYALMIVGGKQYVAAANVLRALTPVLFFSFPAMLLGWPTLGAIGKAREVTTTTILTAILQVVGLGLLISFNNFELISIALLRGFTELFMLVSRTLICWKNRKEFN